MTRHLWLTLALLTPALTYEGDSFDRGTTVGADLLVVDNDGDTIERFDAAGVPFGPFVPAGSLDTPFAACFGWDGHLYVTNRTTDSVLRFHGETGALLDEFVTSGSGGLESPLDVVFGPDGNLYVSAGFVYRYDGRTGAFLDIFVDTLSVSPHILFGPDGNLYLAEETSSKVSRYDGQTGAFIDTFVTEFSGGLNAPTGLAFQSGHLYVSASGSGNVLRYDGQTGAFIDEFVPEAELGAARDLVFGTDNHLYVSSSASGNVRWYDGQTGATLGDFTPPNSTSFPTDLAFFPTPLFTDGFESGDTTRWSQTLP